MSAITSQNSSTQTASLAVPTLWVEDVFAARSLTQSFQISAYRQINSTIPKGEHYILAHKHTPEALVRGLALKIAASGCEPKVYGCNLPIESLLADNSGFSARELIIQILEFAQTFEDWASRQDEEPLRLKEAVDIASLAIALLKEPQKSIELGTLRERCNTSSYDWNKLMGKLEEEFQKELERRQGTNVEADADERLRMELMALLKEADPIKKARKKAEISTHYSIKLHEIDKILSQLKRQSTTPEVKVYDLDSLFALESAGLEWLIPELLPKGETIICAGSPKAGKSVLSIDAAFAIATGESSFLGENVKRGKVLLVCPDASLTSVKNQLLKRGFRAQDKDYIRIIPMWTIDQIDILEAQLEDFRPDVTIVDSLRRINHGSPVSENSAEFADNIYTLKETIGKYGSSGILIHHTNKDKDAMGVGKLRGSSAIAGAVWGTWQLDHIPKPDPNNKKKLIIDPADPRRVLSVFARDTEGQSINIVFNPENNSWEKTEGSVEEEHTTIKERILNVLELNSSGLSGREIIDLLGMAVEEGRGVYTQLNRMVNKRLISCKPAPGDKRYNIYSLPTETYTPPPPPPSVENVEQYPESHTTSSLNNTQQNTQQPLNNYSTTFGDNDRVEDSNIDTASNLEILNTFAEKEGGGGEIDQNPSVNTLNVACDNEYPSEETLKNLMALIFQCKIWVEFTEMLESNESKIIAVVEKAPQRQINYLCRLLSAYLLETNNFNDLTWLPDKLTTPTLKLAAVCGTELKLKNINFQLEVGDRILCYPNSEYFEKKWEVKANVIELEVENGWFVGAIVEWYSKKKGNIRSQIPGGCPEWILKKL